MLAFFETSSGRLPLEQSSDRRETLGKRVSDDSRHFMFRRPKDFLSMNSFKNNFGGQFFFQETSVSGQLGIFERQWQIARQKLLPVVHLFLGRVPWRRGKQGDLCFRP